MGASRAVTRPVFREQQHCGIFKPAMSVVIRALRKGLRVPLDCAVPIALGGTLPAQVQGVEGEIDRHRFGAYDQYVHVPPKRATFGLLLRRPLAKRFGLADRSQSWF